MSYLIRNCELDGFAPPLDVRLMEGIITAIAQTLPAAHGDEVIEARGGRLLPGLHDHHIHLLSLAASLDSIHCGPAEVTSEPELAAILARENTHTNPAWLRGVAYHPSVAGEIDRHWLDRFIPDRPARIQHRGGRLWVLNSAALHALGLLDAPTPADTPRGIEQQNGTPTGRLYECDRWLRTQLGGQLPALGRASRLLASCGVTGITDTTPGNAAEVWHHFRHSQGAGELLQTVRMMGSIALADCADSHDLHCGEYKIHLLEAQLPDFDDLCAQIRRAHAANRNIAIHCVTLAELVFATACLKSTGVQPGDRIEHASITPPALLHEIAGLGLRVVTQPNFVCERGEQYIQDVQQSEQAWLYPLQGFLSAGIPLAGGTDAPFGNADPWQAMAAAVSRKTSAARTIGAQEALTPEQALALFTSSAESPGLVQRKVEQGADASVCLLDHSWSGVRSSLSSDRVIATWNRGRLIYTARCPSP